LTRQKLLFVLCTSPYPIFIRLGLHSVSSLLSKQLSSLAGDDILNVHVTAFKKLQPYGKPGIYGNAFFLFFSFFSKEPGSEGETIDF